MGPLPPSLGIVVSDMLPGAAADEVDAPEEEKRGRKNKEAANGNNYKHDAVIGGAVSGS